MTNRDRATYVMGLKLITIFAGVITAIILGEQFIGLSALVFFVLYALLASAERLFDKRANKEEFAEYAIAVEGALEALLATDQDQLDVLVQHDKILENRFKVVKYYDTELGDFGYRFVFDE